MGRQNQTRSRKPPVTTLFRPRLMAAFVACFALTAPAQAQFDPFHRQAPPADIPGGAAATGQAAELVLRVNQLEEELRQANGRIEELENAEHRLETELQKCARTSNTGSATAPGRPPAPDVAEAPQSPGEPAAPARPRKSSDAFDPDADPNAPGAPRPLGTTPPSTPLVREAPGAAAGQPLELGKAPAPNRARDPAPKRTDNRRLRGGDARSAARAVQCGVAGLSGGAISGGRSRLQGVSRRQSVASDER